MLFGSLAASLIVDPGAVFTGSVVGDTAAADGLVLAGSGSGSLNMAGTFSGLASIQFDTGVDWTLSGSVAPLASGAAIDGFTTGDTIVVEGFSETGYQYMPGISAGAVGDVGVSDAGDRGRVFHRELPRFDRRHEFDGDGHLLCRGHRDPDAGG